MCLATSTMGLDPQGRLFERKIRRGATKAIVTTDIQAKHAIERSVVLNTNSSGRTPSTRCLDNDDWKPLPFEAFLARYKDALLVALNTDYFLLRLDEKGQKDLLAKLVLPQRHDFPPDKIAAVERALGQGAIDFSGEPFAVIARAYKKLFDERQVVNRQVKEFVVPEELAIPAGVDSTTLQKELERLRGMRSSTSTQRDQVLRGNVEKEKRRAKLEANITGLDAEIAVLKKKVEEMRSVWVDADSMKALREVAANSEKLAQFRTELLRLSVCIENKDREIREFEDVPDAGTECPTCRQNIDPENLKKLVAGLSDMRRKFVADKLAVTKKIESFGDVDGALKEIAIQEQRAKDGLELKKSLTARQEALRKAEEELQKGAPSEAIDKLEAALAELDAKIGAAEDALRPAIAAEERKKEIAHRQVALEKLKASAGLLDGLVKYFDKDGIKAELIATYIGGFESKMNAVLSEWGYRANLSIDPYELMVTDGSGVSTLATELSGSEQLMFSLALQCAVSRTAGIGFVVADRLDTLLPKHRQKANKCLFGMVNGKLLEQVILIVAEEKKDVPPLPGSAWFYVEEGTAKRILPNRM